MVATFFISALSASQSVPTAQSLPEDQIVTTKHQIKVDGRLLRYTARAGRLPIMNNESGEVHGQMFFISYTLDAQASKPRPLMFLWNGGPGSSSSLVHLLGFGPKRLQPDGTPVDNEGTWLESTDLVFVDPIGTGYSRPTKVEYGPEFYQPRGDAESVAEFIRLYRNRFDAWDAPIFLAGESYGVTRAAGVADALQRRGIVVSGVVLMGLQLPLGQLTPEQLAAFAIPNYTAAAFVNHKLEPALQNDLQSTLRQAEDWAQHTYLPDLIRRNQLTDAERQTILTQLSRFSGLDRDALDPKTLTLPLEAFTKKLLTDRREVVGRYDSRLVGPLDPSEQLYDPTKDPSLRDIISDIGVVRYLRNELNYRNDLKYQGPFGGGYPPATSFRGDWMSVKWSRSATDAAARSGVPSATPSASHAPTASSSPTPATSPSPTPLPAAQEQPLKRAMTANPELKVFVACGDYDLICNYAANTYLVTQLDESSKRNVVAHGYPGGHALYTDSNAQMIFKRDIAQFIGDVMAQNRSGGRLGN